MQQARSRFRNAGNWPARARLWAAMGLVVLLALACGLTGRSQSGATPNPGPQPIPQSSLPGLNLPSGNDMDPVMAQKRMLALNMQRQKQMVSDANRLLKLAKELNAEVAAGNNGELTLDELDKIAEIEKLARNVRERMIDSADQPSLMPPLPLVFRAP